jgi:hypothetical protein
MLVRVALLLKVCNMFGARVDEQVAPRDHRLMAGKDGERRYNELPGSRNSRSTPTGTYTYARR